VLFAGLAAAQGCPDATLHGSFRKCSLSPRRPSGPFAEVGKEIFEGTARHHATATLRDEGDHPEGAD